MTPTTETTPTPRRLTLRQIARSIVIDLRSQDRAEDDERQAIEQIRAWRQSAAQAGDRPVFQAIDYLGERAAAEVYQRGGHFRRFTDAALARLERWWTRRFA